jgi:hypothetical protein
MVSGRVIGLGMSSSARPMIHERKKRTLCLGLCFKWNLDKFDFFIWFFYIFNNVLILKIIFKKIKNILF